LSEAAGRSSDAIGRLAFTEFAVLAPTPMRGREAPRSRLGHAIERASAPAKQGRSVKVGLDTMR